jgi:hypothetical protein
VTATFTYFGEKFEYAGEFPSFEFFEFQEAMDDGVEAASARANATAVRLAVACVAEKDQARFRSVSRKNKAKTEDWLKVFRDWTEDETERPTGLPTDSSDGHTSTPETSESKPEASVTSLVQRSVDSQPPAVSSVAMAAARKAGLISA